MLNAMSSVPFWEGHVVEAVREESDGSLLVVLAECQKSEAPCGVCRKPCSLIHERRRRRVRDALAQLLTIAHVAKLTGLHWHTIKTIDQRRLERLHGEFSAQDVRRIVMDEFALHKGHRYATVVLDAQDMRVLRVGEQ